MKIRLLPVLFRSIAADDVAAIVADVALASPARNERRSTESSPAI
jgi:hypothetical protein